MAGVQPTVLSLPSGPGSIEGLGESFQPQLNSGMASYTIPFAAPPGRAGFAPSIGIAYNGGDGNGPVGLGWRLNLPSIQRRTDKEVRGQVWEAARRRHLAKVAK